MRDEIEMAYPHHDCPDGKIDDLIMKQEVKNASEI